MQGIAVFLASNALQLWSHSLLASLAASSGTPKGGTDVYQVPKGVQSFSCQLCPPFSTPPLVKACCCVLQVAPLSLYPVLITWLRS